MEPKGSLLCFSILPLVPILSQINAVYIFPSYSFKVHFSTIFPSTPVCPAIFSSKTPAFLFFPIHATWPLSTSMYDPLRQTHVTWFVMEWRMKSFGSQKHLICFWHFGAYVILVFSGKTSHLYLQPPPHFIPSIPWSPSLFFLYFFTIFFCLSVCLLHPVYYSQKLWWKFYCYQMMWCLFFFLAFLLSGLGNS